METNAVKPDSRGKVLEVYKGTNVREYNIITLRVSPYIFKRFIDAKIDRHLSQIEAVRQIGILCEPCHTSSITKFNQ